MLAPPRSKRPRSPSPPSSPSLNSPLELLIKRRRNERLQDQQGAGDVDEEWAGVEKRRNRMWERAQDPGPSRLPALDETEQSLQVNYLATPAPTLARASQQHHHHHQPSSSPIRPADGLPSYSPFGANALESSTSNTAVAYREPRGYFDLGTPGSPATGDLPSPSPFPAAWDSPYARSNALLHQLHLARLAGPQATLSLSPLVLSPQLRQADHDMDMDDDPDPGPDSEGGYGTTNRMLGELDRVRQQRWAGERQHQPQ